MDLWVPVTYIRIDWKYKMTVYIRAHPKISILCISRRIYMLIIAVGAIGNEFSIRYIESFIIRLPVRFWHCCRLDAMRGPWSALACMHITVRHMIQLTLIHPLIFTWYCILWTQMEVHWYINNTSILYLLADIFLLESFIVISQHVFICRFPFYYWLGHLKGLPDRRLLIKLWCDNSSSVWQSIIRVTCKWVKQWFAPVTCWHIEVLPLHYRQLELHLLCSNGIWWFKQINLDLIRNELRSLQRHQKCKTFSWSLLELHYKQWK